MNRFIPFYSKFIGGYNNTQLLNTITRSKFLPIIDYAKEGSKNISDIISYKNTIIDTMIYLNNNNKADIPFSYAIKLSSFTEPNNAHLAAYESTILNHMNDVLNQTSNCKIFLDAEDMSLSSFENIIYKKLVDQHNPVKNLILYKTYQMYKINNLQQIIDDIHYYNNIPFGIKLVRGAYYHKDRMYLHSKIEDTHNEYNKAIIYILDKIKTNKNLHLLIATHNNISIHMATNYIENNNMNSNFKSNVAFAQLFGMNDSISNLLLQNNYTVYKYIPYGSLRHSLPYLIRRLYENYDILKNIK